MAYELRKSDENVFIADTAVVVGDVTLSKGVSVWFQAVVRGDEGPITVGENTNIQDAAILHAETHIGKNCTIGHGAIVHGCTVGDNTLIGKVGQVAAQLRPAGVIVIGDKRYDAVSDGELIEAGSNVVVIKCNGFQLVVKRIK